jgi:ABC-type branched-subunit amino acid transport system permease subunit
MALVLAGLCTAPVGALVAIPAIRLSGIYLALVTLGFGIFMQYVVFQTGLMFGATTNVGIVSSPRPKLAFVDGRNDRWFYFVVLALAALIGLMLVGIQRAQLGRLMRAMSESPTMLVTSGLSVNLTRLLVFSISASVAGIAGGLMVTEFGSVDGTHFAPMQSVVLVAVLTMCGVGLLRSAAGAALAVAVIPGYLTFFSSDWQTMLFGVAASLSALGLANRTSIAAWVARAADAAEERRTHGPIRSRWLLSEPSPAFPSARARATTNGSGMEGHRVFEGALQK